MKHNFLNINGVKVGITKLDGKDYICITDIAKGKGNNFRAADVIRNWLRTRSVLEFLIVWEKMYNPNFKVFESEHFKNQVGLLTFTPSVNEWCEKTNAIGIFSIRGKYGVTYAHKDIALEFASSISPVFKLYLIKEFERLKKKESLEKSIEWNVSRILAKTNYFIQTSSIKKNIVPVLTDKQKKYIYAEEADVLNVALFGMTAKEWREENPELAKSGNIRDYADLISLIILSNLENINAELIENNIPQTERLIKLNNIARKQYEILDSNKVDSRLMKL